MMATIPNFRNILQYLPEVYFTVLILASGIEFPLHIPWPYLALACTFLLQIYWKSTFLLTGTIVALISIHLWFLMALLSEFSEFPKGHNDAPIFLATGLIIFVINAMMIYLMTKKLSSPSS